MGRCDYRGAGGAVGQSRRLAKTHFSRLLLQDSGPANLQAVSGLCSRSRGGSVYRLVEVAENRLIRQLTGQPVSAWPTRLLAITSFVVGAPLASRGALQRYTQQA